MKTASSQITCTVAPERLRSEKRMLPAAVIQLGSLAVSSASTSRSPKRKVCGLTSRIGSAAPPSRAATPARSTSASARRARYATRSAGEAQAASASAAAAAAIHRICIVAGRGS
jgi:hypothetical protein